VTEYALHVESGPRHKKTMVHVPALLGCIARGPTTEEALEATPAAVREFLAFMARHGERASAEEAFTTVVAEHVTQGSWIGNGDPTPGFRTDFAPLPEDELRTCLRRLDAMREEFLALLGRIPHAAERPESGGRSALQIAQHVAGADCAYVRTTVGKVEGLTQALRAVEQGEGALEEALRRTWDLSRRRLEGMTEAERVQASQHGQTTWTARRGMRRMLEHQWEHLKEIDRRA
jgi:predicted RNase H-like HicB family nuclease